MSSHKTRNIVCNAFQAMEKLNLIVELKEKETENGKTYLVPALLRDEWKDKTIIMSLIAESKFISSSTIVFKPTGKQLVLSMFHKILSYCVRKYHLATYAFQQPPSLTMIAKTYGCFEIPLESNGPATQDERYWYFMILFHSHTIQLTLFRKSNSTMVSDIDYAMTEFKQKGKYLQDNIIQAMRETMITDRLSNKEMKYECYLLPRRGAFCLNAWGDQTPYYVSEQNK